MCVRSGDLFIIRWHLSASPVVGAYQLAHNENERMKRKEVQHQIYWKRFLDKSFNSRSCASARRKEFTLENQSEARNEWVGNAERKKKCRKCHFISSQFAFALPPLKRLATARLCEWPLCLGGRQSGWKSSTSTVFATYLDCISYAGLCSPEHSFLSERKFRCRYSNAFPDIPTCSRTIKQRANGK